MGGRLKREIRQTRPFSSPEHEAFLNLQRTAGLLNQALAALLKPFRLTPTQYNVLRILRGAEPDGLPCGEIGDRMVTPMPDVTRLLDRLEVRELVRRERDARDRRVVEARITATGLERLSELDSPMTEWLEKRLGVLAREELETLISALEGLRS